MAGSRYTYAYRLDGPRPAAGGGPITITAVVNDFIPFREEISGPNGAAIAPGVYADATALAAAVQATLNASVNDQLFAVTVVGGALQLTRATQIFVLLWASSADARAVPTAIKLGWPGDADVGPSLSELAPGPPV